LSAPVIWIIFPAVVSVPLFFLRKKSDLICLIQSGICILLAGLILVVQFEPAVRNRWFNIILSPELKILGRSLTLNVKYTNITCTLYGYLAIWSLVLFFLKENSLLIPLGLLFNSLMLSALTVEPFLYSALIIEVAVIICIPILIEGKRRSTKGITRFLFYITLGMPFILLAGWFLAGGEISPINEEQLLLATLLLGLGFIFWLAVFPFHSWMSMIAEETKLIKSLYVLIILPIVVFILLLKYLDGFLWLRDYSLIYDALRVFGLIMVISGSVWAIFQTNMRRMVAYLLISSLGTMLLSVSVNRNEGFSNGALLILPRLMAFLLASVSITILEKRESPLTIYHIRSASFQYPLSSLSLILALISIVGMPLTIGFAPMLMLYSLVYQTSTSAALLLLITMSALTIFIFRIAYQIFLPVATEHENDETKMEKVMMIVFLSSIVVIGIQPGITSDFFYGLVSGFEFLIR